MELLKDKNLEEQFHNLVKKFLAKNEEYDISRFIGGLPITLERSHVNQLMLKYPNGDYKYTVTQKVDGTRVLMYIGKDISTTKGVKQRTVVFIDRNMKIYTLRDSSRGILPKVNSREMLLDGELVFFDHQGKSYKELDSRYVKGISFMAFDILFGPEDVDINSDGEKIMGQEFSMTVPSDGILKTFPWRYKNRYDILYKLIIPVRENKSEPVLTMAFKNVNWFNIEIKPIYFMGILKDHRILYNDSKTGYLQKLLSTHRKDFYNYLMKTYGKQVNIFIQKSLELDGLIFTSADTLYTIGSWNKPMSTQYKWKPPEQQTVDLLMKKTSSPNEVELYMMKRGKLEPYQTNYKPTIIKLGFDMPKNEAIGEFTINSSGIFVFKEFRNDKKDPNAFKTIMNVITSFKNPVNINDLYYFLNLSEKSNEREIRKVLGYSSQSKLIQCASTYENFTVLESGDSQKISEMIRNINVDKDIEVELRLGKISNYFNTNINRDKFSSLIDKLNNSNFEKQVSDFVDVSSGGIRTRYLFSPDFEKYILFESVVKNRLTNLDINFYFFLNVDIRVSMSSEVRIAKYNLEGDSRRKYRISFTDPNSLFRVDFTSINKGVYKDRTFLQNKDSVEELQVEIELLSNDINVNNLFKFLINLLSF